VRKGAGFLRSGPFVTPCQGLLYLVCTTMLPPPISWLNPLSYTSCSTASASSHQILMRKVSGEPSPAQSMNL